MGTLHIISCNVKGFHNPVKKKKILLQLKQAYFRQETHLPDVEHEVKMKLVS